MQRSLRRGLIAQAVVLFLHAGSNLLRRSHAFPTAAPTWPRRSARRPRRSGSSSSIGGTARAALPLDAQRRAEDSRFAFPGRVSIQEKDRRQRRKSETTTALRAAPATSTSTSLATIAAASGVSWAGWLPPLAVLSVSTLLGAKADRSRGAVAGSGILVTLVSASLFSALLGRTTAGKCLGTLRDVGWEVLLPSSLVFLLLSLGQESEMSQSNDSAALDLSSGKSTVGDPIFSPSVAIQRLALPFVVACVGSVAGCAASFFVSRQWWMLSPSSSGRSAAAMRMLMPPADAAVAASCLAASFVGGSVNFFATAAIVVGPRATPHARALVSSMASVDLVVMAVYFASLGSMLQSKTLKRWFGEDPEVHAESPPASSPSAAGQRSLDGAKRVPIVDRNRMQRWKSNGVGIVLASALALHVVRLARFVERLLAPIVPGTACAFIAIAIPALQRFSITKRAAIWTNMQRVSRPLATYSFLWLFATIGMSVDIAETLREGPACLAFSIAALLGHMGVTLLGCWLLGWQQRHRRGLTGETGGIKSAIRLEEALIASNAAIGGPATAAAFCGQLPDSNRRKAGLTVAATAYGVVGYGIGTTIGVTMFRWFTSMLR
jgi:Protein of unknown function (DUF819)